MRKVFFTSLAVMAMVVFVACGGRNDAAREGFTVTDREGFEVTIPGEINTIVSIAPSNTEMLMALGFGDAIIAADNQFVAGFEPALSVLDMFGLDIEHIISLSPDLVVANSMIMFPADPLTPLRDLGIAVVYIPNSDSIEGVKEDIRFLAYILDAQSAGDALIAQMAEDIAEIEAIVSGISTRRTVYFEISASPFTFGADTFLNELVNMAGGVNIFAGEGGWFSPSLESVISLNPEVILTSTNYLPDPIGEIMGRMGFSAIYAVQNGNVHLICTDTSNRPSHNIVRAIRYMAEAIYPEYFN